MEIDGIAFAAIALVVLGVALPAFLHRRQIAAQLRLQERYSEELRILSNTPHMVYAESDEHCVIHTHTPEVRMAERKVTAKALMRERASRRARIARRTARKQRLLAGAALLLLATLAAWVAVALTTLSVWVPIVLTASAGAGAWFTFVVTSQIAEANEHDEERIAHIATMLTRKATPAQRDFEAMKRVAGAGEVVGADVVGAVKGDSGAAVARADVVAREREAEVQGAARAQRGGATYQARPARVELAPDILRGRAALADPHRSSLEVREPAQMPSYTVKPEVRRVVARPAAELGAMEVALPEVDVSVPYRPKRIGEQLPGAEQGAREVAGLAGGSVLDELLKRRRA